MTPSRTHSIDLASKKPRPKDILSCPSHLVLDIRDQFHERASRFRAEAPEMRNRLDGEVHGDPLGHTHARVGYLIDQGGRRRVVEGPDPGASAPPEGRT